MANFNHLQINGATYNRSTGRVRFTLKEWNTDREPRYNRQYICRIDPEDGNDHVDFPNDLTRRIQLLCEAVCLALKYRNHVVDDS